MGLVSAIFTIIAGLIYVSYQYHKDTAGGCLSIVLLWAAILPPWYIMANTLPEWIAVLNVKRGQPGLAVLVGIIGYGAIAAWYAYVFYFGPKKWEVDELTKSSDIWKEVMSLPEPSIDTLITYRAKLGLPTYPRDDKVKNKAALEAWRRDQYNIRYKQWH